MLALRPPYVNWRQQISLVYAFIFGVLKFGNPRKIDLDPIGAIIVRVMSYKPPRS